MKKILSVALLVLGASAFASDKALIHKSSGGGHMMPEYGGAEMCDVYADKVVITHIMGFQGPTAIKLVEERKIDLQGKIAQIADLAETEDVVQKENNMCDGPYTGISATRSNGEEVQLFSTGGCGSKSRERQGLASSKLVQIVDLYCPTTFKSGIED